MPTDIDTDHEKLRSTMADAARRLTTTRIDAPDPGQMLATIVTGVLVAVPHAVAASITLIDKKGALTTHAPSNELVSEVDRIQTELHEGPCVDALSEQGDSVTNAPDLSSDPPWPTFARVALDKGFAAVLSFQLRTNGSAGAVNLYGSTPYCFSTNDQLIGSLFADQATVALAGARRAGDLNRALSSRDVIGRAKGILMERFRLDDARAFAMLVESSQHTNMKLHDVAAWLVGEAESLYETEHTAEVPETRDVT